MVVLQRLAQRAGRVCGSRRPGSWGAAWESARFGAANGGGARAEVEVFPAQAEEFALAQSGVESEFEQSVQPVSTRGGEKVQAAS